MDTLSTHTCSITQLARFLTDGQAPTAAGWSMPRRAGLLNVWETSHGPDAPARHEIYLCLRDEFLLLVDQFRFGERRLVELELEAEAPLEGGRLRTAMKLPDGSRVGVHLLGDYAWERKAERLIRLRQRGEQGRFLVVLTADPNARVRVLNGWSIEVRSGSLVHHLLHANRAGKQRSVGPVLTDARYALASWQPTPDFAPPMMLDVQLQVIQATQIHANLLETQPVSAPDWVI